MFADLPAVYIPITGAILMGTFVLLACCRRWIIEVREMCGQKKTDTDTDLRHNSNEIESGSKGGQLSSTLPPNRRYNNHRLSILLPYAYDDDDGDDDCYKPVMSKEQIRKSIGVELEKLV